MSGSVNALIDDLFAELRTSQRIAPFIQRAEREGLPHLAHILRALAASEGYREKLARHGLPNQAYKEMEYYVCPHCGLMYDIERPDQCLVDETPGSELEYVR